MASFCLYGQVSSCIAYNSIDAKEGSSNSLDEFHEAELKKRIYAYVEAVNFLLNPCATDDVIAKAVAEMLAFKQRLVQTAVSFPKALKNKSRRRDYAFSGQRTKSIFVKGLPLNVRDSRCVCIERLDRRCTFTRWHSTWIPLCSWVAERPFCQQKQHHQDGLCDAFTTNVSKIRNESVFLHNATKCAQK